MNTAKHAQFAPGPCTCEIIMRTGETLDSSLGDRLCSDISRIQLCPMHAAAPAMYAALREAEKHLTDLANYGSEGIPEPLLVSVRSAIAQAEGE